MAAACPSRKSANASHECMRSSTDPRRMNAGHCRLLQSHAAARHGQARFGGLQAAAHNLIFARRRSMLTPSSTHRPPYPTFLIPAARPRTAAAIFVHPPPPKSAGAAPELQSRLPDRRLERIGTLHRPRLTDYDLLIDCTSAYQRNTPREYLIDRVGEIKQSHSKRTTKIGRKDSEERQTSTSE